MKGQNRIRRRRIVLSALGCAVLAAGLVFLLRVLFPDLWSAKSDGESFASGYLAVVTIVPLIVMFSLASVLLATLGALAREKLFTFLTLVVIALTWTVISPHTVQEMLGKASDAPQEQAVTVVFLAVALVIFLIPLFFLLALRSRRA